MPALRSIRGRSSRCHIELAHITARTLVTDLEQEREAAGRRNSRFAHFLSHVFDIRSHIVADDLIVFIAFTPASTHLFGLAIPQPHLDLKGRWDHGSDESASFTAVSPTPIVLRGVELRVPGGLLNRAK